MKLLRKTDHREVGILLGLEVEHGMEVFASFEDSLLVLGPPRSGKSSSLIIPSLIDFPGSVVTTSTRTDVISTTLSERKEKGPVAVFDPQGLAAGLDVPTVRWDPVAGCEDAETAIRRTGAFVAAVQLGPHDQFWAGAATALIRCLLHATALSERGTIEDVTRWVRNPADSSPYHILASTSDAVPGWAEELAAIQGWPPATSGSVFATAQRAFDSFAIPSVLASCQPPRGEGFDPESFLRERGTLYVLGTPSASMSTSPLLAAIVQEVVEAARREAARSPLNNRLDPPLLLALDEAANIAPLPDLPQLMATGGGDGIVCMVVLQSMSQAVHRWGQAQADALRDSSTLLIALPGIKDEATLRALSTLSGETEVEQESVSTGGGGKSRSTHRQRLPRYAVHDVRSIPAGHALVVDRRLPVFEVALIPYWERSKRQDGLGAKFRRLWGGPPAVPTDGEATPGE